MNLLTDIVLMNRSDFSIQKLEEVYSFSKLTSEELELIAGKIEGFKEAKLLTSNWLAQFQYDKQSGSLVLYFPRHYNGNKLHDNVLACCDINVTNGDSTEVIESFIKGISEYRK